MRCGSARRGCLTGGRTVTSGGSREIPRWRLFILHGGVEKFFGLMISFFGTFISFLRSFISFLRSFISPLGEEFSFSRELSGISSVEVGTRAQESVFCSVRDVYIIVVWRYYRHLIAPCARVIGSSGGSCLRLGAYPRVDKRGRVAVSRGVSRSAPRRGSRR